MDWQSEREEWNAQGQCAREACRASLGTFPGRHPTTNLLYCDVCTALLEEHQRIHMPREPYEPEPPPATVTFCVTERPKAPEWNDGPRTDRAWRRRRR